MMVARAARRAPQNAQNLAPIPGVPRWAATLTFVVIVSLLVLVALTPVILYVSFYRGDEKQQHVLRSKGEDQQRRFMVVFESSYEQQRVIELLPGFLREYVEERLLESSGIRVVDVLDPELVADVKRLLETLPGLAVLLQDRIVYRPPTPAADLVFSEPERRRFLRTVKNTVQWQRDIVRYEDAASLTNGSSDVVVAVIDTGCDWRHPSLLRSRWVNTKEAPANGVDEDANRYVDDVDAGYDFAGRAPAVNDTNGHGTHCAGLVAGGDVGVAPGASVMCLKVSTGVSDDFLLSAILAAFDYAQRMGARVVSCSFGPRAPIVSPSPQQLEEMRNESRMYERALAPLVQAGVLVVAAAGNENTNLDQVLEAGGAYQPCFMALRYPENVMCVLATDEADRRWRETINNVEYGSNFGARVVDIGAPGRRIWSSVPPLSQYGYQNHAFKTGSSMATPIVAGVAALVLSILGDGPPPPNPGALVKRILIDTADRLRVDEATRNTEATVPRVNAYAAVLRGRAWTQDALQPVADFDALARSGALALLLDSINVTHITNGAPVGCCCIVPVAYNNNSDIEIEVPSVDRCCADVATTATFTTITATLNVSASSIRNTFVALLRPAATATALDFQLGGISLQPGRDYRAAPGYYAVRAVLGLLERNQTRVLTLRYAPGSTVRMLSFVSAQTGSVPPPLLANAGGDAPAHSVSSSVSLLLIPESTSIHTIDNTDAADVDMDRVGSISARLSRLNFSSLSSLLQDAGLSTGMLSPIARRWVGIARTKLHSPSSPPYSVKFYTSCSPQRRSFTTRAHLTCALRIDQDAALIPNSTCVRLGIASQAQQQHEVVLSFFFSTEEELSPGEEFALALAWRPCADDTTLAGARDISELQAAGAAHWDVAGVPPSPVSIGYHHVVGYVPGVQCTVRPAGVPGVPGRLTFRLPVAAVLSVFSLRDLYPAVSDAGGTEWDVVNVACYTYLSLVRLGVDLVAIQPRASRAREVTAYAGNDLVYYSSSYSYSSKQQRVVAVSAQRSSSSSGVLTLVAVQWLELPVLSSIGIALRDNQTGTEVDRSFLEDDDVFARLPIAGLPRATLSSTLVNRASFQSMSIVATADVFLPSSYLPAPGYTEEDNRTVLRKVQGGRWRPTGALNPILLLPSPLQILRVQAYFCAPGSSDKGNFFLRVRVSQGVKGLVIFMSGVLLHACGDDCYSSCDTGGLLTTTTTIYKTTPTLIPFCFQAIVCTAKSESFVTPLLEVGVI